MGSELKIGKVPNEILKSLILDKLKPGRPEVIVGPGIGEDCCAVDFGNDVCILSSDPITGAENEVGSLAVHVSCNDIASCGVQPVGLMVTILAPPGITRGELGKVMQQISDAAAAINVDIIGGHTEVTEAVNRMVISTTALGKAPKGRVVLTSGAKPGDDIILTKTAGLEGTAIIARDKREELCGKLGVETVDKAAGLIRQISVVKEGVIAGSFGVNSMHDVTEGGVFGALWEVAAASETGVYVYQERIPVSKETRLICEVYGLDPYRLISSGSMLITCSGGEDLVRLLGLEGINAAIIGRVTEEKRKLIESGGEVKEIEAPGADELYKVV